MVLLEILHCLGKWLACDCPIYLVGPMEKSCVGKVELNCKEERDPVCLTLKTPKPSDKETGVSCDVFWSSLLVSN